MTWFRTKQLRPVADAYIEVKLYPDRIVAGQVCKQSCCLIASPYEVYKLPGYWRFIKLKGK